MSATRAERAWWRRGRPAGGRACLLAALLLAVGQAAAASAAGAQASDTTRAGSVTERLGLDRLRLSTIGVTGGVVKPAEIEAASLVSVNADYGEVAPGWRVVFSATYWSSHYTDATVRRLADSLTAIVVDPTGDARVEVGPVRVSVIGVSGEARWSPWRGRRLVRPYLGGALGLHAVNAEGRGISGTFIESALDNIAGGVAVLAGGDLLLIPNLSVGMQARYDLLSGARFGSLRAGASYVFNARRGA